MIGSIAVRGTTVIAVGRIAIGWTVIAAAIISITMSTDEGRLSHGFGIS